MKKTLLSALLISSISPGLAWADNIANCEVVLMEPVVENDEPTGAEMASFRPAAEFMSSVYDDAEGYVDNIDGLAIRGVLCQRKSVIPSLRDFPIIATGIPFSLSDNFDRPDSQLVTVYFKDDAFQHKYAGKDLSKEDKTALADVMDVFNLQSHNLGKPEKDEKKDSEKKSDKKDKK